jgi:hypothetical protein
VEGFKSNPKMKSDVACYKEGGSVYKSRTHKDNPKEAAEDKAIVKKGIRQHEAAKHKGEDKTEIKLKQGGRCKKEGGNVRKYKAGGAIDMKKTKEDKKTIAQTKKTKAGKADTPSAAAKKKKESPKTDNKATKPTMTASMVGTLPDAPQAPSAAMSMPEGQPIEMMADGGPAGMGPVTARESAMAARMARGITTPGMGPMSDRENDMMMGQGQTSDAERQMMRAMMQQPQMGQMGRRKRGIPQGANFGPLMGGAMSDQEGAMQQPQMPTGPGMGGAAAPGPMGNAAPMGPTQDIMRGLQTLGQYAKGGEVC